MAAKHTKNVLDLTFMDIENEENLMDMIRAESGKQIRSPSKKSMALMTAGPKSLTQPIPDPEVIKAVRLANNKLENLEQVVGPMLANVDTGNILWLDLSFNNISSLGSEVAVPAAFANVTTIYLHANNISKLGQLKKLRSFPNLKSLTLYGNPIEEHKHYRNYVMYYCQKLHQFDSSPVTGSERQRNEVWAQTFRKVLNREEDENW
jgi:Leucine-rich repeat (LRR) protein